MKEIINKIAKDKLLNKLFSSLSKLRCKSMDGWQNNNRETSLKMQIEQKISNYFIGSSIENKSDFESYYINYKGIKIRMSAHSINYNGDIDILFQKKGIYVKNNDY